MTAMMLSFAVSSVILRASRCHRNRTLVTGGWTSSSCDHERGGSDPLTAAVAMAVAHDMAHSFNVVDALPVKTDEGGESHRAPARHRQASRCGIKKEVRAPMAACRCRHPSPLPPVRGRTEQHWARDHQGSRLGVRRADHTNDNAEVPVRAILTKCGPAHNHATTQRPLFGHERKCLSVTHRDSRFCTRMPACVGEDALLRGQMFRTCRSVVHRPGSGPDSEHAAEYPGASAPAVLLLLHDFPDPGRSHRFPCSSPPRTHGGSSPLGTQAPGFRERLRARQRLRASLSRPSRQVR